MMMTNKILRVKCDKRTFLLLRNLSEKPPKTDDSAKKPDQTTDDQEKIKKRMFNVLSDFKVSVEDKEPYVNKINIPSMRKHFEDKKKRISHERKLYKDIDPKFKTAVKNVAKTIGGSDPQTTESELVNSVKAQKIPGKDLRKIMMGMKIDQSKTLDEEKIGFQAPHLQSFSGKRTDPTLFSAPPLNLLPDPKTLDSPCEEDTLEVWKHLKHIEMKASVTQHPRNQLEEMIRWTEQRKLWQFPIDNEIDMDEEKATSFADHIFLERHLDDWCPQKGPIRHFMELVCTGLSKNPYISAKRKRDHIEWYRNYFEGKQELLKEVGAM